MTFDTLTRIHKLLTGDKDEASIRLKAIVKEFAEFNKTHPWADEQDFDKYQEMTDAKESFDRAARALKEFESVKWQGIS